MTVQQPRKRDKDSSEIEKLIQRAKGWNEYDLRQYPSATLELIDALWEALEAKERSHAE